MRTFLKKEVIIATILLATCMVPLYGADRKKKTPIAENQDVPELMLEGHRSLRFVGMLSSEREVNPKRALWKKVLDLVAGPPEWHRLIRPYSITKDSRGRLIITDPGALEVHVFDLEKKKYQHLDGGRKGEAFQSPIGVATDGEDNIYVTDSALGKVFVFDAKGKFVRYVGEVKGEGLYKRPTGIAIDKKSGVIYLTDTLRHKIYKMDLTGNVTAVFGKRGTEPGEFNFPTEVILHGDDLVVVDAMNFRVQVFDKSGGFRSSFGRLGTGSGSLNRPKGLSVDSDGNYYLVDNLFETVQVFNAAGRLLYYFGHVGMGPSEFQLPSGIFIDSNDRIYVADSFNRRVQIFQYVNPAKAAAGGQP